MSKKIVITFLTVCIIFATSCSTANRNKIIYTNADMNILATMYYDGCDSAYFGFQNNRIIENIDLYSLVWHIKACTIAHYPISTKNIQIILKEYMDSNDAIGSTQSQFDPLYARYLESELVHIINYPISNKDASRYFEYIDSIKNDMGLYEEKNDTNRSTLATTYLVLTIIKNLEADINSLKDTKEALKDALASYELDTEKEEVNDDILLALNCYIKFNLSNDEKQMIVNKYKPFINKINKDLNNSASQYYYKDYFYLPATLDTIQIADFLGLSVESEGIIKIISNIQSLVDNCDIQTITIALEIAQQLSSKTDLDYLNRYLTNYFKNHLYYDKFLVNNQLNYFGLLCADIMDFKFSKKKIKKYIMEQDISKLGIRELYFFVYSKQNLHINNPKLEKKIFTQYVTLVEQYNESKNYSLDLEELYYFQELSEILNINLMEGLGKGILNLNLELEQKNSFDNLVELYYFAYLNKLGYFQNLKINVLNQLKKFEVNKEGYKYIETDEQANIYASYLALQVNELYGTKVDKELKEGITELVSSLHASKGGYYNSNTEKYINQYSLYYGLKIQEQIK